MIKIKNFSFQGINGAYSELAGKNIFPKAEAAAPNKINTKENPIENNNNGIRLIFLLSINSSSDCPDINEI